MYLLSSIVELASFWYAESSQTSYYHDYPSCSDCVGGLCTCVGGLCTFFWRPFAWSFSVLGKAKRLCVGSIRFATRYVKRAPNHPKKQTGRFMQDSTPVKDVWDLEEVEMETFGQLRHESQAAPNACHECLQQIAKTSLEKIISYDRTLEALARHLHAYEIRSLGQTSKAIRSSLYVHKGIYGCSYMCSYGIRGHAHQHDVPTYGADVLIHEVRQELLSNVTCSRVGRTSCWACSVQICRACTSESRVNATPIQQHMDSCTPYCHKCHFRALCSGLQSDDHSSGCCSLSRSSTRGKKKLLCTPCSREPITALHKRRTQKEIRELQLLANQAMRCANCDSGLPERGPRWWICDVCKLECTNECHDLR